MANQIVAGWLGPMRRFRTLWECIAECAAIGLLTSYGIALHIYLPTISFLFLLLVIAVSLLFGFRQASFVSLLAAGCLDFFFTPPLYSFDITNVQDYVALGAFEVTALVIS